jgi:hypothetical protein
VFCGFLFFKIGSFFYLQFGFSRPFLCQILATECFGDGGVVGLSDPSFVAGARFPDLLGNCCQYRTMI